MHLESEDIINQPADLIYPLVRDEMPKLVPYLQNVEKINMISKKRRDSDGKTEIVNHWFAKADGVPSIAQKFVTREMLSWKDHAVWNDADYCVEYTLESFVANDLFSVKGLNFFQPYQGDKNRTLIRVTCDVEIYPEKMPGVPKFLAKTVQPAIEGMLKKILGPNLTSLGKGLIRYFEEQGKSK